MQSDDGLFEGVEDPIEGATGDLRKELAGALANHPLRIREPEVLASLRAEALTPGRAGAVSAGLFDTDKEWLLEHAAEIIEGTPAAYTIYLLNLALRREQLVSFVSDMRSVVPDQIAETIARERFEGRPELLEEVIRGTKRPWTTRTRPRASTLSCAPGPSGLLTSLRCGMPSRMEQTPTLCSSRLARHSKIR